MAWASLTSTDELRQTEKFRRKPTAALIPSSMIDPALLALKDVFERVTTSGHNPVDPEVSAPPMEAVKNVQLVTLSDQSAKPLYVLDSITGSAWS